MTVPLTAGSIRRDRPAADHHHRRIQPGPGHPRRPRTRPSPAQAPQGQPRLHFRRHYLLLHLPGPHARPVDQPGQLLPVPLHLAVPDIDQVVADTFVEVCHRTEPTLLRSGLTTWKRCPEQATLTQEPTGVPVDPVKCQAAGGLKRAGLAACKPFRIPLSEYLSTA